VTGQELVGRTGVVTTAVRGGLKPGEVRIVVEGLPHHYLAYCAVAVAAGAEILVINERGHRQLDVEPWGNPSVDPADIAVIAAPADPADREGS
jgi:hypothetical protein